MSAEGRALLMRTKSAGLMRSPLLFDVLHTLERDMKAALEGKTVALADWTAWLKKGEPNRQAFAQAFFLLVAIGGLSARDVKALRVELANVVPSRRRRPQVIHGPQERQTRGLF